MAARKQDVVQAGWNGGTRYLWDRSFHVKLMQEMPETRPHAPEGFWDIWNICQEASLCDPWRAAHLATLLEECSKLPGDIMECGTWQGGVSVMFALLLKRWGVKKKVFMLDSFQGLPRPNPSVDRFHQAGWCLANRRAVEFFVKRAGVENDVVIVPGWFQDTLPTLEANHYAMVHLDGDLYASTKVCLDHVEPRMEPKGVVALDDFHDAGEGVKRATLEHAARTGETLHAGPVPQVYFRSGVGGKKGREEVSFTALRKNKPYVAMVAEVARRTRKDAAGITGMERLLRGPT